MQYADERAFVECLAQGDEKAFMHLVDLYHKKLYAYCIALAHDHSAAEDIVQNVFLKTWSFRRRLDPRFSLKGFLYKTAYNEFLNEYQRNKEVILLKHAYIEVLEEVSQKMDEEVFDKMIFQVTQEIQKLPKKCREIFTLSKKEGLTNNEISDYLNVSVKTVEAHITKAFNLLRERLDGKYESFLFLLFRMPN